MARVTARDVDEVLPAVRDAILRAPVFGEVVITIEQGRVERIEARPNIRVWHRGMRKGVQD
ncbi:MAG: hypothetical protein CW346_12090 [Bacillaceae bacterium]|nr:hypothetical protein [Bacillaceae bacterium]